MDYKKIRGAAMAYYANLSDEEQLKAWEFFKSIDTDGSGTISRREYRRSLEKIGYPIENTKNEFKMLDKNGDGVLDFEECITLFYLITVHDGTVYCDGCGIDLWDIYFVCVGCYVAGGNTYDLCCDCYRKKNFEHPNAVFCDNLTLFRRMQPTATSASQVTNGEGQEETYNNVTNGEGQEETYNNVKTSKGRVSKRAIIKKAIEIGTLGVNATNAVTAISKSANVIAHSAAAHNVVSAAANVDCPIM